MEQHDCCHCSQRKKERSPEEYKRLIHRLNRIEGQIRGIRGMVEAGAYCPDILVQAAAVKAATHVATTSKRNGTSWPYPDWKSETSSTCSSYDTPY